MKLRWAVPVVLVLLLAALTGCTDSNDSGESAPDGDASDADFVDLTGQDEVTIDVRDNVFDPERVLVSPGTEVRWENRGRTPHNVVASEEGAFEDVPVDQLQPGDEATRAFDEPGSYPYFCSLHGTADRGQVGELRVVEP